MRTPIRTPECPTFCPHPRIRAPTTNFLKKWSQSRVLGFYEALFAIMEAAFYAKRHLEGLGKC
ncbi:hypothetical protein, partial [Adlercreutzia equolifaciens]|uniref:hypothetical protein n=1 Tax=Adlercreutzia equolifaciens TaxID=446660 RepID=UPI001EDE82A5